MNAITTKSLLSETKGYRIKATDDYDGNSIIISIDPGLDPKENHMAAAIALANKMQWCGILQGGLYDNIIADDDDPEDGVSYIGKWSVTETIQNQADLT